MGLSTSCRAPCEPGALQPQQPPPRRFRDPSNTHTTKPGARDPGTTVRHKKLLYFSSRATLQDRVMRNSVLSQINLLWDILKILLLLKSSQSWFSPCYPPRFLILSIHYTPGRSMGVGQTSGLPNSLVGSGKHPSASVFKVTAPAWEEGNLVRLWGTPKSALLQ